MLIFAEIAAAQKIPAIPNKSFLIDKIANVKNSTGIRSLKPNP